MAVYEANDIPLEDICEKYLGLNINQAKRKALRQQLPFPVFRTPGPKIT